MISLPLRRLNIWQVYKISFKVWLASLRYLWPLALLIAIIEATFVIPHMIHYPGFPHVLSMIFIALTIAFILLSIIPSNSIFVWLYYFMLGKQITCGEALYIGWKKWFPTIGMMAIMSLLYLAVAMVLILPILFFIHQDSFHLYTLGIFIGLLFYFYITVIFIFAYPIIITEENIGVFASFKKSYHLTKNHWWQTAWIISIASIALLIINQYLSEHTKEIVVLIFTAFFYQPFYTSLLLTQLHNLKIRHYHST